MGTATIVVGVIIAVGLLATAIADHIAATADPLDGHYADVTAALGEEVAR